MPRTNRLLRCLSNSEIERVKDNSDLVYFKGEQHLWGQGEELSAAYIPLTAVISLLQTMSDGLSIEVASVGSEGIVGVPLVLGNRRSFTQAVCQVPGQCLVFTEPKLKEILQAIPKLDALVRRYAYVLLRQLVQAAGCNSLHSVEDRFVRVLLEMQDRSGKTELELSQQFIAEILGVRRETIGQIAGHLQRCGHISYVRGRIEILDRRGLEGMACECYDILKKELDEIFT